MNWCLSDQELKYLYSKPKLRRIIDLDHDALLCTLQVKNNEIHKLL